MAAITEQQLADGLEALYDQYSDDETIDVAEARRLIAEGTASLIAQFVQGRETLVAGVQSGGSTATGIIQ